MALLLDRRERLLSDTLGEFPHVMKDLAAGDVLCTYDDGTQWVCERKTTPDLARSIRTGPHARRACVDSAGMPTAPTHT